MNKRVLGLFIEGHIIRAALVSRNNEHYEIEMLETFKLYDTLEQPGTLSGVSKNGEDSISRQDSEDPFDLQIEVFEDQGDSTSVTEAHTNLDVISELLARMCPKGTGIAFNLCDSNVIYKTLSDMPQKRPTKIKKEIWAEFNEDTQTEAILENVGYLRTPKGQILGLIHDDPLIFASLLYDLKSITRRQPPQIKLVDTIELALAHEIQKSMQPDDKDHIAVVTFSKTFAKVFFMRGDTIETVLPTIDEGANSETVCETIFSKILFEFDMGNIGPLTEMVLVGDYKTANAEKFFAQKLPNLPIKKLDCGRAVLPDELEKQIPDYPNYSIAIALALKAMEKKVSPAYNTNFLPRRIHDKQSIYKVAWHGVAMLGIVFIFAFLLTMQIIKKNQEIEGMKMEIAQLDQQIQSRANVEIEMDSLMVKIANLEKTASLLDSLSQNTTRWTPILETFSDAYRSIGAFHLISLETPNPSKLIAEFEMTKKDQVARLERFIDKSMVLSVTGTEQDEENSLKVQIECNINKSTQKDQPVSGAF